MSALIRFYRGEGPDTEGRFLKDICAWGDEDLEEVHDFIQWLFPLPEPSQFNPDAPLLGADDITAFQTDLLIQANLRESFKRILAFLGLATTEEGKVIEGAGFARRVPSIWASPNHNWLRITRILRSLSLLGREADSVSLYECLKAFHDSGRYPISATTFRFWTDAASRS